MVVGSLLWVPRNWLASLHQGHILINKKYFLLVVSGKSFSSPTT